MRRGTINPKYPQPNEPKQPNKRSYPKPISNTIQIKKQEKHPENSCLPRAWRG